MTVAVVETPGAKFYKSKDEKQWFIDPITAVGRIREHNVLRSSRSGPKPGTVANPVGIFRSILTPEIVDVIVRETNRKANEVVQKWNANNPSRIQ